MNASASNILVAILFLAIALAVIGYSFYAALNQNKVLSRRLGKTKSAESPQRENIFEGLSQHLTMPSAEEMTRIRYHLAKAGYYAPSAVRVFYTVRVLSLVIPQLLYLVSTYLMGMSMNTNQSLGIAIGLVLVGFLGPDFYIKSKINKRRQQAKDGFPDMMDLLVSCIEAGLGLDAALMSVADELGGRYPVLKINLDFMNLELRAGRSRHESLRNFGERLGLEEAKALALMLRQSEEMGSSLGASLRTFSEEMRDKRMLLAEEKAMALSAKLTVPLIVFIFPTIMIMLLLPAGLRLSSGLG